LDFDHPGAVLGQHCRRERPGQRVREVEHGEIAERGGHGFERRIPRALTLPAALGRTMCVFRAYVRISNTAAASPRAGHDPRLAGRAGEGTMIDTRRRTLAPLVLALLALPLAAHQRGQAQQPDPGRELATTIGDGFTLASVGDLIVAYPASQNADPAFKGLAKIIQ